MSLLKKISALFSPRGRSESPAYWIYARCRRCGEPLRARLDLYNELSAQYADEKTSYVSRKVLMGEGRCFQRVEVWLTFDEHRQLIDRQISGGEFIDQATYQEDMNRQATSA